MKRKTEPLSPQASDRKQRILTHKTPSIARSIADAIVIKDGNLFFLTTPDGRVPLRDRHGYGLYHRDCRYLSGYELHLAGERPDVLFAGMEGGFKAMFQLTNRELDLAGDVRLDEHSLGLSWMRLVQDEHLALYDHFTIRNYGTHEVEFTLALSFEADFSDVFAIRGLWKERPGRRLEPEWRDGVLHFDYEGADARHRRLGIAFSPEPTQRDGTTARFRLKLAPDAELTLAVTLHVADAGERARLPDRPASSHDAEQVERRLATATRDWESRASTVHSDDQLLNRIVRTSTEDLHALRSTLDGQEYFAAGVPWFATLFGRDSAVTALQMLAFDPAIAANTLRLLARYQGQRVDAWRDEQPGKILHELRIGELAGIGAIPHTPYYGSVDATPLFLLLLAEHARWTGSLALFDELRAAVEAALGWIDAHGDLDGDGFVDYDSPMDYGVINQGWKDSGNAIVNTDGCLARPPIAMVEVQAYVYAAKQGLAELFERRREPERAASLRREAEALRERFNQVFWLPERGFYAMALQAGRRPVAAIGSNAGHALWAGVADADKAARVAKRLMAPDMFSGWGVRTLSSDEAGYNPIGYHLGTVWPHDNALIAAGLRRYGHAEAAMRIFSGLFDAATYFRHHSMPEVFCGFRRETYRQPVPYPVACHPQAWAAGSWPLLFQTMLGLEPAGFDGVLRVVDPLLPKDVNRLELRDVDIAGGKLSLRFERDGDRVKVHAFDRRGDVTLRLEGAADGDG